MSKLNVLQQEAVDRILQGHNIVLMGPAGTGKSFTVKYVVKELEKLRRNVAVTATTGISCCVYENAMTIHKWSGIADGRYEKSEIRSVIEHNIKFQAVKNRIKCTDTLFIDEYSMLSSTNLECINEVCQIKDHTKPFGGIQVIIIGDFLQLPPVPNSMYNDTGKYCFESSLFAHFPHRINLEEVVRQNEKTFINVIREVSVGEVSDQSIQFLKELSRPLLPETASVKLFATNDQVDSYNRNCIMATDGDLYEFHANDDGERKYLARILAPRVLWVKIGSPVILLKNLSDKLVNGLREVTNIKENKPVITFSSIQKTIPIEKVKFTGKYIHF
jgi:ATP-dependent DNA helicase PIF1